MALRTQKSLCTRIQSQRFLIAFRDYMVLKPADSYCIPSTHATRLRLQQLQKRSFVSSSSRWTESLRPQTHYEYFPLTTPEGPPPNGDFSIDLKQLKKEFLQLQAKAHPDRHQGGNKARAEGLSSQINEAYKTLQNPLLRAQYLLSLQGIDVAEDETAKVKDPELLMEVLEMREDIEAAQEEAELVPMKQANDEKIEHSVAILDDAFKRNDIAVAKEEAVRLRYWINIKESLDAWEKGKPVVLVH